MIVYKVVRKVRTKNRTEFRSAAAINGGKYNLDYRIGRKRHAPQGSLLFVFSTLEDAQDFACYYSTIQLTGYRILECETDGLEPIRDMTGNTAGEKAFAVFWKTLSDGVAHYNGNSPPRGTTGCASLTPLKIVDRWG